MGMMKRHFEDWQHRNRYKLMKSYIGENLEDFDRFCGGVYCEEVQNYG